MTLDCVAVNQPTYHSEKQDSKGQSETGEEGPHSLFTRLAYFHHGTYIPYSIKHDDGRDPNRSVNFRSR
jgi:regulator of PEP synthase PpsR (kinase-PPPase family)